MSSVFQFAIWIVFKGVNNLLKKQVEEVHVEENFETPTTKRNNELALKFNEKWKEGHPWF